MQVGPGVHRLTHGVSNYYIVEGDGGLTLVDAGVQGDWDSFGRYLASLNRSPGDLKAIVLTHAHADHTGFAERARQRTHSAVWVHQADEGVAKGSPVAPAEAKLGPYLLRLESWRTVFGLLLHGGVSIVPILEVSAFQDGATLDVPGKPKAVHLPGHTEGMSAVLLEDRRVICTGDALVTRNPLTGRKGPQIMPRGLNRNSEQAIRSLSRLEGLSVDTILPGHGDPWTGRVDDAVREAKSAGYS